MGKTRSYLEMAAGIYEHLETFTNTLNKCYLRALNIPACLSRLAAYQLDVSRVWLEASVNDLQVYK